MYSSASMLNENSEISLAVATVYKGKEYKDIKIGTIRYFMLPLKGHSMLKYNRHLESYWYMIRQDFNPDIVHIHGTEYPHGLSYVRACGGENVVVSIQGLLSSYYRYYYSGLTGVEIARNITYRDILRQDNIFQQKKKMERRSKYEREVLSSVNHIIGRTSWDRAHSWAINPKAQYHYCNETLRPSFYKHVWSYENCEKHSIFMSQAGSPIKGLHQMLKAMSIVRKFYPDTKLYIAGDDISNKPWYKLSGYGKIIMSLLDKLSLKEHVFFTGPLDEKSICKRYLKSNVFICPSTIENSPNSLCEAQLLGMPYLASYVGGISDLTYGRERWLYRFEEYEMLAWKVCNIFKVEREANVDEVVKIRHDAEINRNTLLDIYNDILKCLQ